MKKVMQTCQLVFVLYVLISSFIWYMLTLEWWKIQRRFYCCLFVSICHRYVRFNGLKSLPGVVFFWPFSVKDAMSKCLEPMLYSGISLQKLSSLGTTLSCKHHLSKSYPDPTPWSTLCCDYTVGAYKQHDVEKKGKVGREIQYRARIEVSRLTTRPVF